MEATIQVGPDIVDPQETGQRSMLDRVSYQAQTVELAKEKRLEGKKEELKIYEEEVNLITRFKSVNPTLYERKYAENKQSREPLLQEVQWVENLVQGFANIVEKVSKEVIKEIDEPSTGLTKFYT